MLGKVRNLLNFNNKRIFSVKAVVIKSLSTVLFVSLPAFFARPWSDETFLLYLPEHIAKNNPLLLVQKAIVEIPGYLQLGVFRPLSRLLFYIENWTVLKLSIFSGVEAHILRSAIKVASVGLLILAIALTIRQYQNVTSNNKSNQVTWKWFTVLFPVIASGLLFLKYPGQHPLILFPSLYLGSAAFAMLLPLWFGNAINSSLSGKKLRYFISFIFGVAIASMIELTYLAIPLSILHLIFLHVLDNKGESIKSTIYRALKSMPFRYVYSMIIGFIIVFVPTRAFIADYCNINSCYKAATVDIDSQAVTTALTRTVAPAVLYVENVQNIFESNVDYNKSTEIWLFLFSLFMLYIFFRAIAFLKSNENDTRLHRQGKEKKVILISILYFSSALLLASIIAGLSAKLQSSPVKIGPWRDTAFTWVCLSAIIALILSYLVSKMSIELNIVWPIMLFLLVAFPAPTLLGNFRIFNNIAQSEETRVHKQISLHVANFDDSEEGNTDRCLLIQDLHKILPSSGSRSVATEINTYLDSTTSNNYNSVFCKE